MGRPRTRRKRKRRQRQRGGKMPWVVDVKKGYEVTRDMIKALKKHVNVKQAKRTVSINSIKEEAAPKATTVGSSTKGTPRGTRPVAFNNGTTTKKKTTTTTTPKMGWRQSRVHTESGRQTRAHTRQGQTV